MVDMEVKGRLYEGIAVPTALYGITTWNKGTMERRLNVMEVCLRSICDILQIDQMRNGDVQRTSWVVGYLVDCVEQRMW